MALIKINIDDAINQNRYALQQLIDAMVESIEDNEAIINTLESRLTKLESATAENK